MRAALCCSALAFLVLVDGCGSSCPDKTKSCLGVCVSLDSDSQNCGACGNVCTNGQVCSDGGCTVVCPTGSTVCNDLCVDTETDQANCGGCGKKCPSGQACGAGACGTSCLAGFSICGAGDAGPICADLLTDPANCGACGSPCLSGSVCNGKGSCAESCASGFNVCASDGGSFCADFVTDNQNCGSCAAPCPSGDVCSASHCGTTCAAGFTACNDIDGGVGTCANFLTDSVNCGGCGKVCPAGQVCTGGTCAETCAVGFSACGGGDGGAPYCANFLADIANCGGCAKPCSAGQVCNGDGTCAESCAAGFSACGTDGGAPYCANLVDDANNCGTCAKACAAGETCKSSACTETCTSGYSVCGGADGGALYCANVKDDANNCGKCGDNCGSSFEAAACCNKVCTGLASGDIKNCGTCGNACTGTKPGCCEAGCVDESSDVNNCGGCGKQCSGIEPGCCSEGCVDESHDIDNCGSCGNTCKAGTTPACCLAADGGACVDEYTDPSNCGACGTVCSSGVCLGNCCSGACGTDTTTNCLGSCDATGACNHPSCNAGYGCDLGSTCFTTCANNSDCAPNSTYTCWNPPGGSCCQPIAAGATIYVDGDLGADTNCCDSAATACQTITFAMKQIAAASATGVTINVAWNGTPTTQADWAPSKAETYPIHLGWGVTVQAPGIFFTPAAGKEIDVFDVYSYKTTDTGTVTIEGSSVDYMYIGFDSKQTNLTGASVAVNSGVANKTAVPLTLQKVWMNGQTEALNLGGGANVSLGPSPVIIGSGAATTTPLASVKSPGSGIVCHGASGSVATLSDLDAGGSSVLDVDQMDDGHANATYTVSDIYAYDDCTITLTQKPIIGVPPPCPTPEVDGEGILVLGGSTLSLTGATVQCMYNHGIDIGENLSNYSDNPTVTLDSTLIQHTGQTGLKCNDGTLGPVTNTSIYHCRFGVVLDNSGNLSNGTAAACSVDLSGGGNIAACSTNAEPGQFNADGAAEAATPGINVWNDSNNNQSINASNVAWDNNPPGYWTCTDVGTTANTCTCASGTCLGMNIVAPDNSDAVTAANTNANPILLNNPSLQTTYNCN